MHPDSPFRPRSQPARDIWDALTSEMSRRTQNGDKWVEKELYAVYRVTTWWSQIRGIRILSTEELRDLETQAMGHSDYAAKWAYAIARRLQELK